MPSKTRWKTVPAGTVPNDTIVAVPVICASFHVATERSVVAADAMFADLRALMTPDGVTMPWIRFTSSEISLICSDGMTCVTVTVPIEGSKENAVLVWVDAP